MAGSTAHWYEAITPSLPDRNGATLVGGKWVEVQPGKSIHFDIFRQANGDFVITGDKASLAAHHLDYRERTIYASQAQAMPSQIIWSIILEGVKPL